MAHRNPHLCRLVRALLSQAGSLHVLCTEALEDVVGGTLRLMPTVGVGLEPSPLSPVFPPARIGSACVSMLKETRGASGEAVVPDTCVSCAIPEPRTDNRGKTLCPGD